MNENQPTARGSENKPSIKPHDEVINELSYRLWEIEQEAIMNERKLEEFRVQERAFRSSIEPRNPEPRRKLRSDLRDLAQKIFDLEKEKTSKTVLLENLKKDLPK